jgi:hypothetical protein
MSQLGGPSAFPELNVRGRPICACRSPNGPTTSPCPVLGTPGPVLGTPPAPGTPGPPRALLSGPPPSGPNRRSCATASVRIAPKSETTGAIGKGVSYGRVTRWFCLTNASTSAGTRRIVLLFSTLVAGMLALAAPASATTETFNVTGGPQTWTVPAGVTQATFDLYGAQAGERMVSPQDSAVERRRRLRSPPAPRSRSTSAVRDSSQAQASTAAAPAPRPLAAGTSSATAAAAPRTFASVARRSQIACSSRAAAGEPRASRVSMGPTPPEAAGVRVRSARGRPG